MLGNRDRARPATHQRFWSREQRGGLGPWVPRQASGSPGGTHSGPGDRRPGLSRLNCSPGRVQAALLGTLSLWLVSARSFTSPGPGGGVDCLLCTWHSGCSGTAPLWEEASVLHG